jgi:uroporphyrinogen decarboxylase
MNGSERIEAAADLKPADRPPVSPLVIGFAGACAGMTQGEIYADFGDWMKALDITYGVIGACDSVFPRWPRDVARMQMLRCRLPGGELGENEAAQAVETQMMEPDEYRAVASGGYVKWFFGLLSKLWGLPFGFPFAMPLVFPRLLALNARAARIAGEWARRGVPPGFDSACYPPFDLFSLVRSMEPFFYDLYDCPELVESACRAALPDIVKFAKMPLRFGPCGAGKKVCVYPMRSSASFISPKVFERFSFPYLKAIVEAFWSDGIRSVLHCDGDWTPMLGYLRELPEKSCIVELDGQTDIFRAKAVLGGRLCIKGDVPASLLAFGGKDEVSEYCCRLIRGAGRDGGFILSSGCEVPLNAKTENVKALVDAAREF